MLPGAHSAHVLILNSHSNMALKKVVDKPLQVKQLRDFNERPIQGTCKIEIKVHARVQPMSNVRHSRWGDWLLPSFGIKGMHLGG